MKIVYMLILLVYQIILAKINRKRNDDIIRLLIGQASLTICLIGALG